jgi:pyruvate/2-oxoglutarate dehydrogenase complex dihydrolipoamide dehydrogenase (E3) component
MDAADIVIIGAGAGAKLIWGSVPGRSVAVVERELVGGYCPFYACVPSKAMLRSARVWRLGADEQFSGLFTGRSDATAAYRQAVGRIVQPGVVEVDGTRVQYRDLVLNTGSTPLVPQVPGLDTVPAWTSEQAMSTSEQPRSVAVIGGARSGVSLPTSSPCLLARSPSSSATSGLSLARSQRRRRRWPSGSVLSVSGCCSASRWHRRSAPELAPA